MTTKNDKVRIEKNLKEIDKFIKELENNVESLFDSSLKQSLIKSKLQNVQKLIENICTALIN